MCKLTTFFLSTIIVAQLNLKAYCDLGGVKQKATEFPTMILFIG